MGKNVTSEEGVLKTLAQTSAVGKVSVGLIIGQAGNQKDFIVHVAPTPSLSKEDAKDSLKEIDEVILSDHARFVTRVLPGGLWILGIFITSSDDIFASSNNVKTIRTLLNDLDKSVLDGINLEGGCPNDERLVLHYNSESNQYACKSLEKTFGSSLKPVDLKFQNNTHTWYKLETQYWFDRKLANVTSTIPLKEQLQEIHQLFQKDVNQTQLMLNDRIFELSHSIDSIIEKKGQSRQIKTTLLSPCTVSSRGFDGQNLTAMDDLDIKHFSSSTDIRLSGVIPCQVYLHPRSTVEDATRAVKQDIIRSLGARIELHLDSLVDEERGSPEEQERVHELPRRVIVTPPGWNISLTDYLFPGEGPSDAVTSNREMLDIILTEDCIAQVELAADTTSFLMKTTSTGNSTTETEKTSLSPIYAAFVVVALIIALLIHFIFYA